LDANCNFISFFYNSKYGNINSWRRDMFSVAVNISDEALVLQVVKYYFPRWDSGEEIGEEDDSEESKRGGSKQSGGEAKGERVTCSRTAATFY
jgi:hypothetical protein